MSGVLVIPNQFATAVTATGAQLDGDFNTVTAYINDPTNRNNYAADAGAATNTVSLTFSPPVVGGYTAGLQITFKVTNGNTGAVVLNANGLGNKNLFSAAGVALTGGEITSGQIVSAAYDGTQFQMISPSSNVNAASAATVSQALSNAFFVTPGRVQNHPGVAKAWATWNGTSTGTITANAAYNVSIIQRLGVGTYTVGLTTVMADDNYSVAASRGNFIVNSYAAGGFNIAFFNTTGTASDFTKVSFIIFGNQ